MVKNDTKPSEKPKIRWRGKQRQIFEYIIDLDVKSLKTKDIAEFIGLSPRQTQRYLTPEFWQEALEFRRRQYAKLSVAVDMGLIKKATAGRAAEVKLFYQKFEDWKEPKAALEVTGKDGGPIETRFTVMPESELLKLAGYEDQND